MEDRQESIKGLLPSGIDSGYHCAIEAISARRESGFPGPEFDQPGFHFFPLCLPFIVKALELRLSGGNFLINFCGFLLKTTDLFGYPFVHLF